MDIEGFELDALMGAKGLIETYKPKLAICVYHKCEDPVSIVEYLAQLVPEYQFICAIIHIVSMKRYCMQYRIE